MGAFSIGGDTVAIVKRDPGAARDRLNRIIDPVDGTPIEKTGCSFQVQPVTAAMRREAQTATTTMLLEIADVFLPVDADTVAIDETDGIRKVNSPTPDRTYEMAGPAVLETDIHGADHHVRLLVEWQAG